MIDPSIIHDALAVIANEVKQSRVLVIRRNDVPVLISPYRIPQEASRSSNREIGWSMVKWEAGPGHHLLAGKIIISNNA